VDADELVCNSGEDLVAVLRVKVDAPTAVRGIGYLCPMPGSTRFATDVPEVAEEMISEAYLDVHLRLDQEEARDFRLRIERFDAGPFQLDEMEIGGRASVGFEPEDGVGSCASVGFEPEDEFVVGHVTRGSLRLHLPDREEDFDPGEVALLVRPGVPATTDIRDYRQLVTALRASEVREAAGLAPDAPLPTFTSARPTSPLRARRWRRARDFISGLIFGDSEVATASLVVGSANRMLAGLLLATFPNDSIVPPSRADDRDAWAPSVIRRAVGFIESHADRDIGLGDIAAASEVSSRTVQIAFRRHLDTTPTAYLRKVRLDLAHAELLAASPDSELTVTEVAYRWGFSSPSRFAERYRAEFGRLPSEMQRR
jgi:AraC-like DNA-binding protein